MSGERFAFLFDCFLAFIAGLAFALLLLVAFYGP